MTLPTVALVQPAAFHPRTQSPPRGGGERGSGSPHASLAALAAEPLASYGSGGRGDGGGGGEVFGVEAVSPARAVSPALPLRPLTQPREAGNRRGGYYSGDDEFWRHHRNQLRSMGVGGASGGTGGVSGVGGAGGGGGGGGGVGNFAPAPASPRPEQAPPPSGGSGGEPPSTARVKFGGGGSPGGPGGGDGSHRSAEADWRRDQPARGGAQPGVRSAPTGAHDGGNGHGRGNGNWSVEGNGNDHGRNGHGRNDRDENDNRGDWAEGRAAAAATAATATAAAALAAREASVAREAGELAALVRREACADAVDGAAATAAGLVSESVAQYADWASARLAAAASLLDGLGAGAGFSADDGGWGGRFGAGVGLSGAPAPEAAAWLRDLGRGFLHAPMHRTQPQPHLGGAAAAGGGGASGFGIGGGDGGSGGGSGGDAGTVRSRGCSAGLRSSGDALIQQVLQSGLRLNQTPASLAGVASSPPFFAASSSSSSSSPPPLPSASRNWAADARGRLLRRGQESSASSLPPRASAALRSGSSGGGGSGPAGVTPDLFSGEEAALLGAHAAAAGAAAGGEGAASARASLEALSRSLGLLTVACGDVVGRLTERDRLRRAQLQDTVGNGAESHSLC